MNTRPREGLDDLVVGVTPRFGEATSSRTQHRKSKKKFSVTAYVDNNCSGSLPALARNCLCVVEVPSVLADASLRGRPSSGLSCMTLGDMLEYLHHTQKLSVKCRKTTRAVIIYIGCDRKLLFRFSVFSSGVQPSELHRKTDHLFGDVNRPASPLDRGGGLVHELNSRSASPIAHSSAS
jgi:hypothetical protein